MDVPIDSTYFGSFPLAVFCSSWGGGKRQLARAGNLFLQKSHSFIKAEKIAWHKNNVIYDGWTQTEEPIFRKSLGEAGWAKFMTGICHKQALLPEDDELVMLCDSSDDKETLKANEPSCAAHTLIPAVLTAEPHSIFSLLISYLGYIASLNQWIVCKELPCCLFRQTGSAKSHIGAIHPYHVSKRTSFRKQGCPSCGNQ